jgi:anti-anti-sigma factor
MADSQLISIEAKGEALKATIGHSSLDETIIDKMQEQVFAAAAQHPALPVVLDMSQVEYIPSLGLGALVGLQRRLRSDGHRFVLVGLQQEVRHVLTIVKLDKLFEIKSSFDEVLSQLRTQG